MPVLLKTLRAFLGPRLSPTLVPVRVAERAPYQRRTAYRHHPGRTGVEPTRFGDWEYNGRCTDFS